MAGFLVWKQLLFFFCFFLGEWGGGGGDLKQFREGFFRRRWESYRSQCVTLWNKNNRVS